MTNVISLVEIFSQLGKPIAHQNNTNNYMTSPIPLSAACRLGKDSNGAPALLIQALSDKITDTSPIRLQHLNVVHDANCLIHCDGDTETGKFSIISCTDADRETEIYFIHIVEALLPTLGKHPSAFLINQAINQLVELFRALRKPPIKTSQGLWAELFLLAESSNPRELIDAWHAVPNDLYDFNSSDHLIEVKSTQGENRKHRFSLTQLKHPKGATLVIVSIIVKRTEEGATINDLIDDLRLKLLKSPQHLLRLYKVIAMTLGDEWHKSATTPFDLQTARRSLAFFRSSDIPMVNPDLPAGVSDVHFLSDLTGNTPYSKQELHNLGGLMVAITPERSLN